MMKTTWWKRFDDNDLMMKTIWWWKRFDDENDLMMKTIWWWKRFDDENDLLMKWMKTIYLSTLNWVDKEFFLIFLYIANLEQTWQNSSNINFKIELRALINLNRSNINLRIEFELLFEIQFYDQINFIKFDERRFIKSDERHLIKLWKRKTISLLSDKRSHASTHDMKNLIWQKIIFVRR
jgi:hypothetical protein